MSNFFKFSFIHCNIILMRVENTMQGVLPSSDKTESPKTPGGISKSLLTPCRRVGLSKKWKRVGSSPFVSPLSSQNSTLDIKDDKHIRKRKKYDDSGILSENCKTPVECYDAIDANSNTPQSCRKYDENCITKTQIPRKLSKSLLSSIEHDQIKEQSNNLIPTKTVSIYEDENLSKDCKQISENNVCKFNRTNSKSRNKLSPRISQTHSNFKVISESTNPKENSPNNLIKECMVVIEDKILKADKKETKNKLANSTDESESEPDIPLSILKKETVTENTFNAVDFTPKSVIEMNRIKQVIESQSSQEDIDKKSILIKKSYDKVIKPLKSKSTGSITQKDIDDLTARIERKKKLLLAKAMSIDTEELRSLIKKWQKGCQDALIELLDLMKRKFPDQQNMEYAEILQTLRIPAELVGYDPENDCFITPEDTNVLLSAFKL